MGQSRDADDFIAMRESGSEVRVVEAWIRTLAGAAPEILSSGLGTPMAIGGSG
jgi:hypothetical protein